MTVREDIDKTIALMGPTSAGTTTLVASLMEASLQEAHGYLDGQHFSITDLDPQKRLTELGKLFMTGRPFPPELQTNIAEYKVELNASASEQDAAKDLFG